METLVQDIRYALRNLVKSPGFAADHGAHPCARHRRQHRHLQRGQRRRPAPPAVSRAGAADVHHQPVPGARLRSVLDLGAGVPRVPRPQPGVRERGRIPGGSRQSGDRAAEPRQQHRRHARAARGARGAIRWLGRKFTREDTLPEAEDVGILSYELWQREFGADRDAVGRVVPVNGVPTRIVGIMPPGLRRARREGGALAAADDRSEESGRTGRTFSVSRRPDEAWRVDRPGARRPRDAARRSGRRSRRTRTCRIRRTTGSGSTASTRT